MSGTKVSAEERRLIAAQYLAGDGMPRIARRFGRSVSVVERALKVSGVETRSARDAQNLVASDLLLCRECGCGCHPNAVRPLCRDCAKLFCRNDECQVRLHHNGEVKTQYCPPCKFAQRYKKKPPRLCRVCGRVGARGSKRDLCAVHIKCFCSACDQAKPPQRVNHRCTACENERKQQLYAKPGRLCAVCGVREIKAHASRCQHCLHEDYEICRWGLLHIDRPCRKCGVTLARGRRVNYCPKCQRQRVKERNRNRAAIGAHRCAVCTEPLSLKQDTYCNGCATLMSNWRAAWHRGDHIAREMGTIRPRRVWQEDAGARNG